MKKVYKYLIDKGVPFLVMDEKSSELTKYASNSFLATKITFMNEVANFCELIGADVEMVRKGMGEDERIGKRFLFPGIGYGGSCFPKDVKALIKSGLENDFYFNILQSVEKVNQTQKTILIPAIENYLGNLKDKKIAVWGLSFKENTDDIREASSIEMINTLIEKNAIINVYDPAALNNIKTLFKDKLNYFTNMYDCLDEAEVLIISTEWAEFRNPNFEKIEKMLKNKAIFDGRNLYDLEEMNQRNFYYKSIGRKTILN